jgi:uncharacterized protein YegP (UPF0339 family)
MPARFQLKTTSDGQFMFNLLAGNNQVVLTSERYTSKAAAQDGITSVANNAPNDARFERRESKDGQWYFVLKTATSEVIGRSERYKARKSMEKGIASVRRNAGAEIQDLS